MALSAEFIYFAARLAIGEAEWAIDPWPLRAKGLIVLVSPN